MGLGVLNGVYFLKIRGDLEEFLFCAICVNRLVIDWRGLRTAVRFWMFIVEKEGLQMFYGL